MKHPDVTDRRELRETIQRRTITVLIISQIIGTVGVGIAPSIGILLAGQVTDNEAWAGLARTTSTLGAAIFGLPLGAIAARHGRRFALSTGWGIAAIGSALLVLAAQRMLVLPLFVGLFLLGVGNAASLQARFAATDLARPENKGRSLSLVVWVGTLGNVLGPNLGLPGQLISKATGLSVFAAAFLIAAVFLALASIVVVIWLRPDPLLTRNSEHSGDAQPISAQASQTSARSGTRMKAMFGIIRSNRPARYALLAIITSQVVMVLIMTMTPVHIEHQGGSVTIVGVTISLHIAGMYIFSPVVGWLADHMGTRPTISLGMAVLIASLLIGVTLSGEMPWIMVSLTLLGIGWSLVNITASAAFSAAVPGTIRATAQGGADAMSNLLGALASFLAGPLLAATSFPILSLVTLIIMVPLVAATMHPSKALHNNN